VTILLKPQAGSRRWQHAASGRPVDDGRSSPVESNYTVILGSHRNSCLKFEKDGEICCMVGAGAGGALGGCQAHAALRGVCVCGGGGGGGGGGGSFGGFLLLGGAGYRSLCRCFLHVGQVLASLQVGAVWVSWSRGAVEGPAAATPRWAAAQWVAEASSMQPPLGNRT
jgi:hypothetical protein